MIWGFLEIFLYDPYILDFKSEFCVMQNYSTVLMKHLYIL